MHVTGGLKRCVVNKESSIWSQRLGHIFIERIKRLVNEGILNGIKGKQTNKFKRGAKSSTNLLEIIHTNICCLDMYTSSLKYFITFIDNYS
ncbi:hypothetical protein CR513_33875, partial [Mucuna pruriens]